MTAEPALCRGLVTQTRQPGVANISTRCFKYCMPGPADSKPSAREAAALLGVSRTRFQELALRHRIRSQLDEKGTRRYERADVMQLLRQRQQSPDKRMNPAGQLSGADVAEIFLLFDDGIPFAQIVIQTKLPPHTIRALYEEYRTPLGRMPRGAAFATSLQPPRSPLDDHEERVREFEREQDERHRRITGGRGE